MSDLAGGLDARVTAPWELIYPTNIPAKPLWYWMTERWHIYFKKERGEPKPWTDDPILQRFRFCNVFREFDKVTKWIHNNIRKPYRDHPHLWFMLAIARQINLPETLEELMVTGNWPDREDFTLEGLGRALQARKERGDQVYTGAYMIRAESDRSKPWYAWTKQRYIAEIVLGTMWRDRENLVKIIEEAETQEEVWSHVASNKMFFGWGPFMTYEWTTDLTHTRYLNQCRDRLTWANPGPGALRGLRRLRNPLGHLEPGAGYRKEAIEEMRRLLRLSKRYLPPGFPALELRDIEHSLCEVDKYLRVWWGEGKPRASYPGTV